jgi:Na+-transporting NADH:ubiquinone oxidoreductase subunit C
VNDENGLSKVILPVRGYGLWSTMSGFVALDKDLNTVLGFGFYDQKETPGLGGEVDNPKWKQLWIGKKIYSESGEVEISVVKGHVDDATPDAGYKVDGLSGATLTSNGVSNLMKFWMGDKGYKPFLTNLKNGEA